MHILLSPLFFFNDTATTEIYTLSLHDALPISLFWIVPMITEYKYFVTRPFVPETQSLFSPWLLAWYALARTATASRSEEHTSELQSHLNIVCRLLLEKKKVQRNIHHKSP